MLEMAVSRAWALGGKKVVLDTCSLDHDNALNNYLSRGFQEVRSEIQTRTIAELSPGPWEGAR